MKQPSGKRQFKPGKFIRYSGMAFQMAATMLIGVGLGYLLDSYLGTEKIFTAIFTLFFVIASMYLTLKDFIKP